MDDVGLPGKGEPIEHSYVSGGSQNEIYEVQRGELHGAVRIPPAAAPEYIAAVMPVEQSEQQRILFSSLGGKDLNLYPQYYVDYVEQVENILKRAKAIDPLLKRNRGAVSSYLESSGRTQEAVKYLPLRGRAQDAAVLVDALSGAPLEILVIDPW